MENISVIVWSRQKYEEGLRYLASSSQSTETAGLLQLVRSFNKGRGGLALLVGLFRFPGLIRLSKRKAAFQWEFTSPWSCFPPFLKYLRFLCVYIQWKFPVHCLDWCPDHMFVGFFFFFFPF